MRLRSHHDVVPNSVYFSTRSWVSSALKIAQFMVYGVTFHASDSSSICQSVQSQSCQVVFPSTLRTVKQQSLRLASPVGKKRPSPAHICTC